MNNGIKILLVGMIDNALSEFRLDDIWSIVDLAPEIWLDEELTMILETIEFSRVLMLAKGARTQAGRLYS